METRWPHHGGGRSEGTDPGASALNGESAPLSQRLLGSLPEDPLSPVAAVTSVRRLRRHDMVYRRGDPAAELFVVQSGTIAIANAAPDGRESVVELVGRGGLFGLCSLFDGNHRSTQARALEPTVVVAVPYEPVRRAIEVRPGLLWGLMRLLAGRLRHVDEALADSVFLDVTGRTAKRLLELAGERDEFQLPVTQEELAAMVGASRERVNKSISTFVRLGWLQQRDRRYRVVDRRELSRRAGILRESA
ncbi:MAG: Crp/Fnr family transcriptional regulator [Acidimicrobiales bacterium]